MKVQMKNLFITVVVTTVFTGIFASYALAGGPANKVTGDVTFYESFTGNCAEGQYRQMDFNAHEAKDGRLAKGLFTETVLCSDGTTIRYFEARVISACVNADSTADFLILFTYDSAGGAIEGRYDEITVIDNGEPGKLDLIYRRVLGTSADIPANYTCDGANTPLGEQYVGGNIQVHYR
jgi:hypothetical protein